jgi:sugar lactone lactonase YvrE
VRRDTHLDFDWAAAPPLPPPFSVEWNGVLHAADYGVHDLLLQTPGRAEVLIGEQTVLSGTGVLSGSLELAEGNHALRVRVQFDADAAARAGADPSTGGMFQLSWRTPGGPFEVIGPGALYTAPMTANGLLARYFPNGNWEGTSVSARIEDQLGFYVHVPPLPRPYTVEYTGKIAIPAAGLYRFGLESIDESILEINGQEIVRAMVPNQYEEGAISLTEGLHDIRIRFADRTDHTHLNVYWMPPGAARAIVPPAVLFPPQGSYANVSLPSLESLAAADAPAGPPPPAPPLGGSARIFATGLQQPRGVAVADDGRVFVAEGGGGKIVVYSPDGEILGLLPQDTGALAEPVDVAIDAATLYVLDAGAGTLWSYALDGGEALAVPTDPTLLDRSRGLAVGPDGRVWIAVTTAGVAAAIDPLGGEPSRLPVMVDGAPGQPVDVAVAADGIVFVTDASANKLLRVAPNGQPQRSWALPPANTLDGPHLAFDAFGNLYVTEPEGGRVEKRDAGGQAVGVWDLPALLNRRIKAVGLDVGPDGRIWVTDSEGGAVVVIEPE